MFRFKLPRPFLKWRRSRAKNGLPKQPDLAENATLQQPQADHEELCRYYVEREMELMSRLGMVKLQIEALQRDKTSAEEQSREARLKIKALTKECAVRDGAISALSIGHPLKGERILELAKRALEIVADSNANCSLSYELFVCMICDEADRVLSQLNSEEAAFFRSVLADNYVAPSERGSEWQSEYSIRRELYDEMYGEESES